MLKNVLFFYQNGSHLTSFLIYFRSFQATVLPLQQINVKNDPSSMQCSDLNLPHLDIQSPAITTRPGVLPKIVLLLAYEVSEQLLDL